MNQRTYMVTPNGGGAYSVHDASTGAMINRFNLPGTLTAGPMVQGDQCTISTITSSVKTTYILKLPTGHIVNRYVS